MSDSATEPADAGRAGWPARIAVIGTGAMGSAFVAGLARAQPTGEEIEVVDVRRDVAEVVANMGLDIRATHTARSRKRPGIQTISLTLEVDAAEQIVRVLARLEGLPAVDSARRVSS